MSRRPALLVAVTVSLGLLSGARAQADLISWGYELPGSWSLAADNFAPGRIKVSPSLSAIFASGSFSSAANQPVTFVAAYVTYSSSAPSTAPVHFSNGSYVDELFLRDRDTGQWGRVLFSGIFTGSLSSDTANIDHILTGFSPTSLVLGRHRYTVDFGPYSAPAYATSANPGILKVTVTAAPAVQQTPEPASLTLLALGGPVLAGCAWRRRRAVRS